MRKIVVVVVGEGIPQGRQRVTIYGDRFRNVPELLEVLSLELKHADGSPLVLPSTTQLSVLDTETASYRPLTDARDVRERSRICVESLGDKGQRRAAAHNDKDDDENADPTTVDDLRADLRRVLAYHSAVVALLSAKIGVECEVSQDDVREAEVDYGKHCGRLVEGVFASHFGDNNSNTNNNSKKEPGGAFLAAARVVTQLALQVGKADRCHAEDAQVSRLRAEGADSRARAARTDLQLRHAQHELAVLQSRMHQLQAQRELDRAAGEEAVQRAHGEAAQLQLQLAGAQQALETLREVHADTSLALEEITASQESYAAAEASGRRFAPPANLGLTMTLGSGGGNNLLSASAHRTRPLTAPHRGAIAAAQRLQQQQHHHNGKGKASGFGHKLPDLGWGEATSEDGDRSGPDLAETLRGGNRTRCHVSVQFISTSGDCRTRLVSVSEDAQVSHDALMQELADVFLQIYQDEGKRPADYNKRAGGAAALFECFYMDRGRKVALSTDVASFFSSNSQALSLLCIERPPPGAEPSSGVSSQPALEIDTTERALRFSAEGAKKSSSLRRATGTNVATVGAAVIPLGGPLSPTAGATDFFFARRHSSSADRGRCGSESSAPLNTLGRLDSFGGVASDGFGGVFPMNRDFGAGTGSDVLSLGTRGASRARALSGVTPHFRGTHDLALDAAAAAANASGSFTSGRRSPPARDRGHQSAISGVPSDREMMSVFISLGGGKGATIERSTLLSYLRRNFDAMGEEDRFGRIVDKHTQRLGKEVAAITFATLSVILLELARS